MDKRQRANKREQRGHFGCTCYHPLNQLATWRDVPCAPVMADGWRTGLIAIRKEGAAVSWRTGDIRISRSRGITLPAKRTRFSSGTLPICLRDLSVARRTIAVSTPSYQAGSWNKKRRSSGVAPRRAGSSRRFHRQRALPSGWWRSIITVAPAAHQGINWTRLSCRKFRCRSAPASRPGLQSGQLHEDTGFADNWR